MNGSPVPSKVGTIEIDGTSVQAMRHNLHELANVFTGVMIAGGLLSQRLGAGVLGQYASDICEGSERGSALVREIRTMLLTACGEKEAASGKIRNPGADE